MIVRFALQGHIVERAILAGAFVVVVLEPCAAYCPNGRMCFVERQLRFVRQLPSGAWLCLSAGERWMRP